MTARLKAWLAVMQEEHTDLMTMDGFDDCIIGLCSRPTGSPFLVYDRAQVLRKLRRQGMTREEAAEFHDYNQAQAWLGAKTPGFIDRP